VIVSVILIILLGIAGLLILQPIIKEPLFGWQQIDGKSYYYDPETGLLRTGWATTTEGKRHFILFFAIDRSVIRNMALPVFLPLYRIFDDILTLSSLQKDHPVSFLVAECTLDI